MSDIETKLSAARTRLILDKPFLGTLVMHLPLVAADSGWCKTTATDARALYYNTDFIRSLSLEQTQFALSHEALHCALSHFARRLHRDKHRWDIACDLAINPLLIAEGLEPCPGALHLVEFEGMSAEEIYPCVEEQEQMEPHDQHVYDESNSDGQSTPASAPKPGQSEDSKPDTDGQSKPSSLTPEAQEQLDAQWSRRLASAHQQALQAGKMEGALGRMIGHLLEPQIPWRMLLARYMTATAREDYNWARPSRREGDAILPSLRSRTLNAVIALDTSGSINDAELQQFVSELNALKGQINARISLLACDSELNQDCPWEFEPWEPLQLPRELEGGGGTDFRPVFDWLQSAENPADLLLYFTDGAGTFPDLEPHIPVIWLIKGRADIPWGRRIQLN